VIIDVVPFSDLSFTRRDNSWILRWNLCPIGTEYPWGCHWGENELSGILILRNESLLLIQCWVRVWKRVIEIIRWKERRVIMWQRGEWWDEWSWCYGCGLILRGYVVEVLRLGHLKIRIQPGSWQCREIVGLRLMGGVYLGGVGEGLSSVADYVPK
jgi:hypothetical protein